MMIDGENCQFQAVGDSELLIDTGAPKVCLQSTDTLMVMSSYMIIG
jgi:hypothetical protein